MTTVCGGKAFDSPVEVGNGAGTHVHCRYWEYSKALALVPYSFPRLLNPVKGTNMSTLLSTPWRQVTKGGSYLDIGMGGHFEGLGVRGLDEFKNLSGDHGDQRHTGSRKERNPKSYIVRCHLRDRMKHA